MIIQIQNRRFSFIAIGISIIGILVYLFVERQLHIDYQLFTENTRAHNELNELFGIAEKLYIVSIGLISLFVSWMAKSKNESKKIVMSAFILSCICIFIPFIPIWKLFV